MQSQQEVAEGVLRASPDGIVACQAVRDAQGRIQDFRCQLVNPAAERLLGVEGAALAGQSILPFLPRQEGQDLRQALAQVVESGTALEQVQSRSEGGVLRWMQLRATKLGDGVAVYLADHTERHNAEEVLRRGQRLLTAIVNTLPHVVYAKDSQGHFLVVNRHFLEFYGVTAQDLAHRRTMDLTQMDAEGRRVFEAQDRQVLSGRTPLLVEDVDYRQPSGAVRNLKIHKAPLLDEEGRVMGLVGVTQDVTAERAAVRALQAGEERFRNLVQGSLQGIGIVRGTRVVFANQAYAEMFGFGSPQEVLALPTLEKFVVAGELERLRRGAQQYAQGAVLPERFEVECLRSDGTHIWVYAMARTVEWGGRPAIQLTLQDITQRKQAEQELRANQQLLQALFDSIPHGVFLKDLQGCLALVNKAISAYWGVPAEELIGKPIPEALLEQVEARQQIEDADRRVLTEGETVETTATMRLADGRIHRLRQVKTPLRDLEGAISGLVAVSTDVTAELEAREQEQLTHRRLRDAIESFPGAFALFDPEERLLLWNRKLPEWFPELQAALAPGLHITELMGALQGRMPGFSEQTPEDPEPTGAASGQATKSWEVRTADGNWLQLVRAQSSSGTIRVALDVTERKLREQELRQAQKMEAVGQLTGGIAHDFNNLLTALMGYGQLLLDHLRGDQAGQAMGQAVLAAVQRGSALTQRLLAYARRQPLNPVELDLNKLVSGMEELIRRTLGEDIEIELVQAGGLWKTMADASQVEDALLNLALNARDAMPKGGKLTIETGNARLDESYAAAHAEVSPGQYVLLAVSDTGTGMVPEVLVRAFDPFFTTKEQGKGSGLGLSMVYGFVKQSGGHVKIYSELGLGTQVKIYLPRLLAQAQLPAKPSLGDSRTPTGTETILLVEDDDLVRDSARALLQGLGYTVLEAADGPTALVLLGRQAHVHLLFTDVVMPGGMDGRQLAERARQQRPGLKVLFTSGYTENVIVHHGTLDPGVRLLSKPYQYAELARKVRQALDEP